IINTLCYHQHELECEFLRSNEMINNDLLSTINKAGEILDADVASPYIDFEDFEALNENMINNDLEESIEFLLRRLKHFDLILSVAENQVIYDLVEFLGLLESASKSSTTMNLYLLLRMEIESMLNITEMESPAIRELKILLFENLNKRYPMISLNICAFLLDPSQLKSDISRYLTQNQTRKELTLLKMIKKFRIYNVPQEFTTESISTPAISSHSTARTTT
ncbi:unnamed protein product, partial [Rotaria sp. Silwood1]